MLRKVIVEANPKQYIRQIVLNKRKLEDYIIYQMQKSPDNAVGGTRAQVDQFGYRRFERLR